MYCLLQGYVVLGLACLLFVCVLGLFVVAFGWVFTELLGWCEVLGCDFLLFDGCYCVVLLLIIAYCVVLLFLIVIWVFATCLDCCLFTLGLRLV